MITIIYSTKYNPNQTNESAFYEFTWLLGIAGFTALVYLKILGLQILTSNWIWPMLPLYGILTGLSYILVPGKKEDDPLGDLV